LDAARDGLRKPRPYRELAFADFFGAGVVDHLFGFCVVYGYFTNTTQIVLDNSI
jgi:hypothetical protein